MHKSASDTAQFGTHIVAEGSINEFSLLPPIFDKFARRLSDPDSGWYVQNSGEEVSVEEKEVSVESCTSSGIKWFLEVLFVFSIANYILNGCTAAVVWPTCPRTFDKAYETT